MKLLNGFGCFLCGSLSVLLCAPANPGRQLKAALAPIDAIAAFAHSDVALASPDLRTALADPSTGASVADPVTKVPLAEPEVNVSPLKASDECVLIEVCIDQYLWSVYERAPKVDIIKVEEQDPPHIAAIDGKEYADKRGLNAKVAEKGNAATSGV